MILDEYTHKEVAKMAERKVTLLEEHIKLVTAPKPRLIPEKLWWRLVSKFLVIERHPATPPNKEEV